MSQVVLVPILAWIAVLIGTGFEIGRGPRPITVAFAAGRFARWICLVPLGLMGLWGFLGHVFFPAETAASIGWAESPFQFEVGVANLAIGVTGLIGAAYGAPPFRIALGTVALFFLGGAAVGHVVDMSRAGNLAPGNAGPILYTDILTPLALLAAVGVQRLFRHR